MSKKIYVEFILIASCLAIVIGDNHVTKQQEISVVQSQNQLKIGGDLPKLQLKDDEVIVLRPKYFFLRDNIGNIQRFFPNATRRFGAGNFKRRKQQNQGLNQHEEDHDKVDDDEDYEEDEEQEMVLVNKPEESEGVIVDNAENLITNKPTGSPNKPQQTQIPGLGSFPLLQILQPRPPRPQGFPGGILNPANLLQQLFRPQNQQYQIVQLVPIGDASNSQQSVSSGQTQGGFPQYQLVQIQPVNPANVQGGNWQGLVGNGNRWQRDPPRRRRRRPSRFQGLQLDPNTQSVNITPVTLTHRSPNRNQLNRRRLAQHVNGQKHQLPSYDIEHVKIHRL